MLAGGFSVCGFHVAFLATHLPGVITACGLPAVVGASALATIGLFNIVGSFGMGWAIGHWRMKSLLSLLYAARGIAILVFLLAPKTTAVVLVFAAVMGLTFLSAGPPTAGVRPPIILFPHPWHALCAPDAPPPHRAVFF